METKCFIISFNYFDLSPFSVVSDKCIHSLYYGKNYTISESEKNKFDIKIKGMIKDTHNVERYELEF